MASRMEMGKSSAMNFNLGKRIFLVHYDPSASYLPFEGDPTDPDDLGCWSALISEEDAASRFLEGL